MERGIRTKPTSETTLINRRQIEMITGRDCERAAELLNGSSNVQSIEFYAFKFDNKAPELRCRIFGMHGLTNEDVEALATELNVAMDPVKRALAEKLLNSARVFLKETNEA